MPITIAQIEQKQFRTRLNGYDQLEVDRYLDEICDHIELLNQQIDMLQHRLSQVSQGPAYARSAVPPPAAVVDYALNGQEELNQARQKARGIIEEAQQDAAEIRARAEKMMEEARRISADAQHSIQNAQAEDTSALQEEKTALEEEIEMLRATARDYRRRFMRLVEDQQHVINAETELFE